jgi:hypothetical protein
MCVSRNVLPADSHMYIPRPIGRLAVRPTRLKGQVCKEVSKYYGTFASPVSEGRYGGFAGFVVDFAFSSRDMYRREFEEGRFFVRLVSNAPGDRARCLRNIVR